MSNTFGIKQSFRSQSISRKFARTPSSTQQESLPSSNSPQNIFESGNNSFASDVLNRKNGGQVQISSSINNLNNLNNNSSTSLPEDSEKVDCRRIVSARLLHMKNYNKAVTRSADHM